MQTKSLRYHNSLGTQVEGDQICFYTHNQMHFQKNENSKGKTREVAVGVRKCFFFLMVYSCTQVLYLFFSLQSEHFLALRLQYHFSQKHFLQVRHCGDSWIFPFIRNRSLLCSHVPDVVYKVKEVRNKERGQEGNPHTHDSSVSQN